MASDKEAEYLLLMKKEVTSEPRVPTDEEISLRAHQLWLEHGCPHGHDVEHWLEAQRQLLSEYGNRTVMPTSEDVVRDPQDRLNEGDSPYSPLKDEAPLATKVDEQVIDPGRPVSRRSKTALDL